LEKDKEALIKHTANVKLGEDAHYGNKINLKLLNALIKHFDTSYAYATSNI
jgi:hypothetical protein